MAKDRKQRMTKESAEARFEELQERNRAARSTKVTADDMRQRWEARRASKAASKPPEGSRGRTVSIAIGLSLIAGCGLVVVSSNAATTNYDREVVSLEQDIAAAEGQLSALPVSTDAGVEAHADELVKHLETATTKGDEVAALQQQFAEIAFRGNGQVSADGAPIAAYLESVEHRRSLAPYFVERALFIDDALAYAPGSSAPFDSDEIDPRFPWYLAFADPSLTVAADPSGATWRLAAMMPTVTEGVFSATWLNTSSATGELLAWATASYYVDGEAFGSLSVGLTTPGDRLANPALTEGE